MAAKINWTPEMELYLKENRLNFLNHELAKHLNVHVSQIGKTIKRLSLHRTQDQRNKILYRKKPSSTIFKKGHTTNTMFKVGMTPWNKGKTGFTPWNKGKSNFDIGGKRTHREKWVKKNGKIPKGRILAYTKQFEFESLKLFTIKQYADLTKSRNAKKRIADNKAKRLNKEKDWATKQLKSDYIKTLPKKNLGETCVDLKEKGYVPVRLDHRTIVFRKVK